MMVFTLAAGTARDRPGPDRPDLLQAPSAPAVGEYQLQPRGDDFTYEERTFIAQIARDGVVTFHDRRVFFDEFLRALGQDLYRMQKARFLAATFDVRMRLAVQAHQDELRTSLEQLPERLAELWHEAAEGDAGDQARDIILTFVRRISPYGTCGR
jgi:hypothetical protein